MGWALAPLSALPRPQAGQALAWTGRCLNAATRGWKGAGGPWFTHRRVEKRRDNSCVYVAAKIQRWSLDWRHAGFAPPGEKTRLDAAQCLPPGRCRPAHRLPPSLAGQGAGAWIPVL